MIRRLEHRVQGKGGKAATRWAVVVALWLTVGSLSAEQFGLFTYEVHGDEIEITRYPIAEVGAVEIPAEIDGKPVTWIGERAFSSCHRLTSVSIPEGVTAIGDSAFDLCEGLTSISIPEGVASIAPGAFYGCSGLTSVSIPEGVIEIGSYTFTGCSGLTSVSIPSSVTRVSTLAFTACPGLTSFVVVPGNPNYVSADGVLFNSEMTLLLMFPCGKVGGYTIPDGVTSVGYSAFSYCSGLTSISIPASVTSMGNTVFSGCSELTSIVVAHGNPNYVSADGVLFNAGLTHLVNFPEGKAGGYTIPSSISAIDNYAFSGCSGLTSISIPSSVTTIGDNAFSACRSLTNIAIPSSVTSISNHAFSGCSGLTSVSIPEGVTSIGNSAFGGCSGLTSIVVVPGNLNYASADGVLFNAEMTYLIKFPEGKTGAYTIPSSVTSIGRRAFEDCTGLTRVTIPSSVTYIGDHAFFYCTGLTTMSISVGVTGIGECTFCGCWKLTSVSIPTSVTSIGDYAFGQCHGLTSVSIPASVISVGDHAFYDCIGLTSAIFLGDAPSIGSSAFKNTSPAFTIYYLSSSNGFTSPTWNGHLSVMLDAVPEGLGLWLLTSGLPAETDLHQDLNGDGVSLLMAYALNLNPNLNLQKSLPKPVRSEGSLSLSFYGAAEGITYTVQASSDLKAWTTEGVTLSDLDEGGTRTASVSLDGVERFMRLVVSE